MCFHSRHLRTFWSNNWHPRTTDEGPEARTVSSSRSITLTLSLLSWSLLEFECLLSRQQKSPWPLLEFSEFVWSEHGVGRELGGRLGHQVSVAVTTPATTPHSPSAVTVPLKYTLGELERSSSSTFHFFFTDSKGLLVQPRLS